MKGPVNGHATRLIALRNGLLKLHKTLLDSEKRIYQRDVARIETTGQFLQLVLHDPWFAWLHELSTLVVAIDERLDEKDEATAGETERFIAQARALMRPDEAGGVFARRYFEAMQRDPDVVIAHGSMVRVLAELK